MKIGLWDPNHLRQAAGWESYATANISQRPKPREQSLNNRDHSQEAESGLSQGKGNVCLARFQKCFWHVIATCISSHTPSLLALDHLLHLSYFCISIVCWVCGKQIPDSLVTGLRLIATTLEKPLPHLDLIWMVSSWTLSWCYTGMSMCGSWDGDEYVLRVGETWMVTAWGRLMDRLAPWTLVLLRLGGRV